MRVEAIEDAMRQHYRDQYMFYQGRFNCYRAVVGYAAMWLSSAMYELNLFIKPRQHINLSKEDEIELLRILTVYDLLTYPAFHELAENIKQSQIDNDDRDTKPVRRLYKLLLKYKELYTLNNLSDISEFGFVFNEKVVRYLEVLGEKGLNQKILTDIFNLCRRYAKAENQRFAIVAVIDYCSHIALDYTMKNPALFFKTPRENSPLDSALAHCNMM